MYLYFCYYNQVVTSKFYLTRKLKMLEIVQYTKNLITYTLVCCMEKFKTFNVESHITFIAHCATTWRTSFACVSPIFFFSCDIELLLVLIHLNCFMCAIVLFIQHVHWLLIGFIWQKFKLWIYWQTWLSCWKLCFNAGSLIAKMIY